MRNILLFLVIMAAGGYAEEDDFDLLDIFDMLQADHCSVVAKFIEEEALPKLKLRFYYGTEMGDYMAVPLNESTTLLNHTTWNSSACMVVYLSGWKQDIDNSATQKVAKVLQENCGCNLILVDWMAVSTNGLYHLAVAMVPNAAKAIAQSLDDLIDAGASLCYISGLSLGGQGAGQVAKFMKNRVKHIISMDPAGPLFYPPLQCVPPISANDADCVEVIHTDRGQFGAAVRTGTIDYWLNGGTRIQPGCLLPPRGQRTICSHVRSQSVFLEALKDPTLFPARECSSYLKFNWNLCSRNSISYIGQCRNDSNPGNYYLRTKAWAPYGMKMKGAKPALHL